MQHTSPPTEPEPEPEPEPETTTPSSHQQSSSAILWQNATRSITVLDLPTSIARAQDFDPSSVLGEIASVRPLQRPFPSNQPRTPAAAARLNQRHTCSSDEFFLHQHATYRQVLSRALDETTRAFPSGRKWCRPRRNVVDATRAGPSLTDADNDDHPKRKLDAIDESTSPDEFRPLPRASSPIFPLKLIEEEIHNGGYDSDAKQSLSNDSSIQDRDWSGHRLSVCEECLSDDRTFMTNCSLTTQRIHYRSQNHASYPTVEKEDHFTFLIPPKSSFYLAGCTASSAFHASLRNQSQNHDLPRRKFDFVLLDPPWPNRSVRRSHKTPGKTYSTATTLPELRRLLLKMDLDVLIDESCVVAIWITNKPAVRELVLDSEKGLFAAWGVDLVEEWLWLKTTESGEPVSELDGAWRKPYEVLLLGRRRNGYHDLGQSGEAPSPSVVYRTIISVPDLHSRKPCLKELIEPLMPDATNYRALEIFARNLVAGWWSWGDECIKFNWEGCYSSGDPDRVS
ncbi:MT-A70-domain-containing protein [Dissoconium aciculare CBS 342.82]|uniref:MT-A70-domain-containing protein n=1 Tax=Dissoconium aciculare CBS 342.82 TaxID=1314786 RepID=A0A6J3M172_9PEZI|nr:MT-A70-domain-containing protein [Dissoconium aciculare CBS 342.82]KAF1821628.1 MT-A70-domain-containing protein [Dissoconium aciculare CBS 342.82]